MDVLPIVVVKSVLLITVVRVSMILLERQPIIAFITVTRATVTRAPNTSASIIRNILTTHILKPRVYIEPVLNLTIKSVLDVIIRDSPNGVNFNSIIWDFLNGVNINF
jgi:hypothetical protein